MKKIYIFFTLLLCILTVQVKAVPTHCFWGYCNSKVTGEFGSKKNAKGAIYIPAGVSQLYKGKTISTVKIGLAAMAKSVNVFITKDLNGESIVTKKAGMLYKGWNEVKLSSAYTIDGEPFYIGYSYEGDNMSMGRSEMYSENGCWADLGDGWNNYATDKAYNALALTIQAKISGEDMPKDLWLYTNRDIIVKKGEPCKLVFGIMNMSSRIARNLKVGYSIDGAEENMAEFETAMGSNIEKEFYIEHPGFSEKGIHTVKFRLAEVDGKPDDYIDNNTDSSRVKVMDAVPCQRMVVEEGTGTWCGYCPKGIVAFAEMSKKYPDTFIGIAVHKGDKMETSSYSEMTFSAYPQCYINRDLEHPTQPESSSLEATHNQIVANAPTVGVEVKANFSDASRKKINAKAIATFLTEQTGLDHKFSFVLLENGITGYYQANNFSGGGLGQMGGFENLPSYASIDMNHVARMNYNYYGIKGSIPTNVEAEQIVEYDAELDVPGNIQHIDSLHLVVLLINSKGKIENAAQVKVAPEIGASISDNRNTIMPEFTFAGGRVNVNGFNGKMLIYDTYGMEIPNNNIPDGLYIIKFIDGEKSFIRKVMLK